MSTTQGTPSPGASTIMRNILVGVTTTVLGSTAIYFLGFHNKGGKGGPSGAENLLVMKEVTTKAWKSYVTTDNIYYKNLLSINKDFQESPDLAMYKQEITKEADRFRKDVEELQKEENLDKTFASMLSRRLEREGEALDKINDYVSAIQRLQQSGLGENEMMEKATEEGKKFERYSKAALVRAATEVEDIAKTLAERYGQAFNLTDFLFYNDYKKTQPAGNNNQTNGENNTAVNNGGVETNQPVNNNNQQPVPSDADNRAVATDNNNKVGGKVTGNNQTRQTGNTENDREEPNNRPLVTENMLAGNWVTSGAYLSFEKGAKFSWDVTTTGDHACGPWQVKNGQLHMKATHANNGQQATWVFNLSNVSRNEFTMTLSVPPYNSYYLTRNTGY